MSQPTELNRLLGGLQKRWVTVLIVTVVCGVIGYGASGLISSTYEATASLIVGAPNEAPNPDPDYLETAQSLALFYADYAKSEDILRPVLDQIGSGESAVEFAKRVGTEIPSTNLQRLDITVQASSSRDATQAAQAIADELVQRSVSSQSPLITVLTNERKDLLDLIVRVEQMGTSQSNIDKLLSAINDLDDEIKASLDQLPTGGSPNRLAIIQNAIPAPDPVFPNKKLDAAIAMLFGFGVCCAVIYYKEFRAEQPAPEREERPAERMVMPAVTAPAEEWLGAEEPSIDGQRSGAPVPLAKAAPAQGPLPQPAQAEPRSTRRRRHRVPAGDVTVILEGTPSAPAPSAGPASAAPKAPAPKGSSSQRPMITPPPPPIPTSTTEGSAQPASPISGQQRPAAPAWGPQQPSAGKPRAIGAPSSTSDPQRTATRASGSGSAPSRAYESGDRGFGRADQPQADVARREVSPQRASAPDERKTGSEQAAVSEKPSVADKSVESPPQKVEAPPGKPGESESQKGQQGSGTRPSSETKPPTKAKSIMPGAIPTPKSAPASSDDRGGSSDGDGKGKSGKKGDGSGNGAVKDGAKSAEVTRGSETG